MDSANTPSILPKICRDIESGRVASNELFAQNRELIIEHEGQEYRLRVTGNGKLILTK